MPVGVLAFALFSCGGNSEKVNEPFNFAFEITDSVQVDFLGEMMLMGYDGKENNYLLATDEFDEYLEVNESGEIVTHKKLTPDGIDAVASVLGFGYLEGDVTVLSETGKYMQFRDAEKVGEITVPYDFQPYTFYPKLGVFNYDGKTYYPKPLPSSSNLSPGGGEFYQALYRSPIIEGQNLATEDTINTVKLPETSALLDGQMHGMLFPIYTQTGDLLLLSDWIEPKIYVYKNGGNGFDYEKTVEIAIPDWVSYLPSSSEDPGQFYQQNSNQKSGNLVEILVSDDYYIAVYTKGIPEGKAPEQTSDGNAFRLAVQKINPYFAAIFDKEFNQLASNIPFPASSNRPMVVNKDGEFVVSKIAGLSETEDDGLVMYKLRLNDN
ncbi:hypothetical protein SAMN04489724_4668 [Algoriphagus locisalis]|uniref:DUF4221 domain-containing protein n=2 Tax=Algoriphagus locisalis TaxID=305507 RepID=A0A1I7E0T0_9BACT|nr:hypothetical protein SAMN04489724_4668 [Algoriphagus locisalis]